MIDAGLPLVQCLEILGSQQDNRDFQKILFQVRQDVESGATLADSLRKHPKAFDDLYCNMVAAGEAGGILDTILQRLSTYIEKIVKLRAAVRSAMVYPVAVITIAIGVVWVILWKVIPTFATLFEGLGAQLAAAHAHHHRRCRNFIGACWWLIFGAIGLTIYLLTAVPQDVRRTPAHRRADAEDPGARDRAAQDRRGPLLPHAGHARVVGRARSSRRSRSRPRRRATPIVEDAIMATRKSVEEGKTISEPLKATDVFPPMVVQMVAVGEQTGALETMLNKIADFYEDEVDEATANLLALLEPIMICFLGVVIGGIVISMYLPMFDLISKIG